MVYNTQKFIHRCPQGHIVQCWLDPVTYPKSASSIPSEGSGELSEGKLTGDNW